MRRAAWDQTWKFWVIGGPLIPPGAMPYWRSSRALTRRYYAAFITVFVIAIGSWFAFMSFWPRTSLKGSWLPWFVFLGGGTYVAIRLIAAPLMMLWVRLPRRIRREEGRVCTHCLQKVGEGDEGVCTCSRPWRFEDLRDFWIAAEVLPATNSQRREARFRINGSGGTEMMLRKPGLFVRLFSPLKSGHLTAWYQRPWTASRLRRGVFYASVLNIALFGFFMVSIVGLFSLTRNAGGWVLVAFGALSVGYVFLQFWMYRWMTARQVRACRRRVRESEGLICTECGFELNGLPELERCPECGEKHSREELVQFFQMCGVLEGAGALPRPQISEEA